MAEFVGPTQGPLGSVQGCPEVRNAAIATTTVELLSDSSNRTVKIAGVLQREMCDCCFSWYKSLHRVTFGSSSSLERIGFGAFPRGLSDL